MKPVGESAGGAKRVSGGDLPVVDFTAFLDETFGFIKANWSDFHALLVDQPDLRFIARWKEAVKANFARRYPEARMRSNWDLAAEMGASAVMGAYPSPGFASRASTPCAWSRLPATIPT